MNYEGEKKKVFSTLEKDIFLNIIQNYDAILTSKQTNASSAMKKKNCWERITEEFNASSIVTQPASTKQLTKLWYNMKAKARDSKTKENVRFLTGGGPSVQDIDAIDAKVIDIDKNILTNIQVDIDSDITEVTIAGGDNNDEAWSKIPTTNKENESKKGLIKTPIKKKNSFEEKYSNKIDEIKMKILEEELNFKQKLHSEELKMKIMEREYREKILQIELEIKQQELKKKISE